MSPPPAVLRGSAPTLVSVSVVGLVFGGFAVILAIPVTSAVATLIDVFVLDHEPPAETPHRQRRAGFAQRISEVAHARGRGR